MHTYTVLCGADADSIEPWGHASDQPCGISTLKILIPSAKRFARALQGSKRMKRSLVISITCLLVTIAFAVTRVSLTSSKPSPPPLEEFQVGIGCRPILVPVSIRGKVAQFLVDTGAATTVLDESFRSELGPAIGKVKLRSSAGDMALETYTCPVAEVGGIHLNDLIKSVGCLDLKMVRYASGKEIRGILGIDFLCFFAVEFDFDSGKVRFWSKAPKEWPDEGQMLAFTKSGGVPCVELQLPDAREQFVLDTGAGASTLRQAVFDRLAERGNLLISSPRRLGMTASGAVQGNSGYVKFITAAGFTHEHLRLDRDSLSLAGLQYLSRFTLRCDFPNEKLYLSKGNNYSKHEAMATSGLHILQIEGHKIVYAVEPGSAAADVGLEFGDVIVTIDGIDASQYDMESLREKMTSEIGRSIELSLLRRSQPVSATFRLRHRFQDLSVAGDQSTSLK